MNLDISRKELIRMTIDELKQLLNSLGRYINTPDESKARMLAEQIRDMISIKSDYGF